MASSSSSRQGSTRPTNAGPSTSRPARAQHSDSDGDLPQDGRMDIDSDDVDDDDDVKVIRKARKRCVLSRRQLNCSRFVSQCAAGKSSMDRAHAAQSFQAGRHPDERGGGRAAVADLEGDHTAHSCAQSRRQGQEARSHAVGSAFGLAGLG